MSVPFKLRRKWSRLFAVFGVLMPVAAEACDVTLTPVQTTARLDYDPFAFAKTADRITFELENHDSQRCDVDVVLLDQARASLDEVSVSNAGVLVRITNGPGEAILAPTATPGTWRTRLEPGSRAKVSLDSTVVQDGVAPAGIYEVLFNLEVRDAGLVSTRTAALPVRLVFAALPRAQMNIVGAVGTFGSGQSVALIDFGVLQAGARRRVYLQVRANTSARLTISSRNLGRLMPDLPGTKDPGVAYSALFVDEAIDLTRPWEKIIKPPATLAGDSLPLEVIIDSLDAHPAGRFSDTLVVELSAV